MDISTREVSYGGYHKKPGLSPHYFTITISRDVNKLAKQQMIALATLFEKERHVRSLPGYEERRIADDIRYSRMVMLPNETWNTLHARLVATGTQVTHYTEVSDLFKAIGYDNRKRKHKDRMDYT